MKRYFVGLTLIIALSTTALAHQGASGVVKERMEAMSEIAANLKLVNGMLRGKTDYDAAQVTTAMEAIARHAAALPHKFPEGTEAAPSEAAPAIWEQQDAFNAIFADLTLSATEVAALAADKSTVAQSFSKVAKTCKACHATFRIDRE
ncbi:MAG: cytochrome c [Paracoccaceae bacterium]|nr:cytochrome c [Paracoccaceae bacterium]MDG2260189.1 cytochrome c [Paracoccaceae bacterium]